MKYGWDCFNSPRSVKEINFVKTLNPLIIVLIGVLISLVGTIYTLIVLAQAVYIVFFFKIVINIYCAFRDSSSENYYILDDYADDFQNQLEQTAFYSDLIVIY